MQELCHNCRRIPFGELPRKPSAQWSYRSRGNFPVLADWFGEGPKEHGLPQRGVDPGWVLESKSEHMQDKQTTCPICRILLEACTRLRTKCEQAQENKNSVKIVGGGPSDGFLRLVHREDGGDGFVALLKAREGQYWYYVTAIEVCVDKDDDLSTLIHSRRIEADSGSPTALTRAMTWVKDCDEDHETCKVNKDEKLPHRVLDLGVGDLCDIRLIESKDMRSSYITLSHCWGKRGHFITTRQSVANLQSHIDFDSLPTTFRDAIIVTKFMGIRYLWIDSICIVQDDVSDWERQSAMMASIYSNAYLTISADAAQDNTGGCFLAHQVQYCPVKYCGSKEQHSGLIHIAESRHLETAAFGFGAGLLKSEPLSTRGWAYQERALSPRLLHYASEQMFFECQHSFISEDGIRSAGRLDPIRANFLPSFLWSSIIRDYSQRLLTKPEDRLPALSGMAKKFQNLHPDDYVAGIWKSTLSQGGLLWSVSNPGPLRPSVYRAPTWSWVSVDGRIAMFIPWPETEIEYLASILDVHITLKGVNPYGEVTHGWLKLTASKVPVQIRREDEFAEELPADLEYLLFMIAGVNSWGVHVVYDLKHTREEIRRLQNIETFMIPMVRTKSYQGDIMVDMFEGVLVAPSAEEFGAYVRLGSISVRASKLINGDFPDACKNKETILLV